MLDETNLIPLCNDSETRLCYDYAGKVTWYWVYAPTAGRSFPKGRTPEEAWKNWYIVLANMTPDKKLRAIFTSAAANIKEQVPMEIVLEAAHPEEVK